MKEAITMRACTPEPEQLPLPPIAMRARTPEPEPLPLPPIAMRSRTPEPEELPLPTVRESLCTATKTAQPKSKESLLKKKKEVQIKLYKSTQKSAHI